ncbi:MAG: hypothetical protein CSA54_00345 [Gammaproteobacteria bacterium]|nr:MAG: hypothetical protein CSA54_00345 [Gammaproteobacteria bacterium]
MMLSPAMCASNLPRNPDQLRHRWEMPLIWLSTAVTILAVLLGTWIFSLDEKQAAAYFGESSGEVVEYAEFAMLIPLLAIGLYIYRFYMAASARANAIRVGPEQMPELWKLYQELNTSIGLDPLPKLYVTNGNGVVNAYALSCNTRYKYIVLHSEIALAIDKAPQVVRFVLAHEMAHHRLGHVALWRIVISMVPNLLGPLGLSTTRAQEYSADRVALSVCNQYEDAMSLLAAGPWMFDDVNTESWLRQCEEEHQELYVRLVNLMSDHAVLVKRYKALNDIEKDGFHRHGEMF